MIDGQLASLGVSARGRGFRGGGPGRKRPRNEMSLSEALARALNGKTMSVTDVAEEVQKKGYQSTSPNFRLIVNAALLKGGMFKRVGRGQYTVK
jgi:hypothetical protein